MKNCFYLKINALSILALLIYIPGLFSQIQQGGQPIAKVAPYPAEQLMAGKSVVELSQQQLLEKDYFRNYETRAGEALHAGFNIPSAISPLTHGTWTNQGDTLMVWQMLIESPGALGIGLILEDFYMTGNTSIFLYDPSLEHVIGSFNHKNNNPHNLLSTQLIPGEQLIIEYREPKPVSGNLFLSSFEISSVIHISNGVADLQDDKSLGNAEWCHVDINCTEGKMWQRQKRGVARMLMKVGNSYFWCSGSLVNNTRQDGAPYFLSAAHCGDDATYEDMLAWQFYFNFERPECFGSGFPAHNVIQGAALLSEGPLLNGSDFRLLRLEQTPPLSWRPYYNGWNRMNDPGNSGVGIHHPAGDAKKISTFDQTVTSSNPNVSGSQMADNSAWRVYWEETDNGHGVTQGGSSGSPLFNEDGLIVGTLTGGSSNCNNRTNPDFYGKLSYHWDQNGDFFYERIKDFLDPFDSDISQLGGYDPLVASFPTPGFVSASPDDEGNVLVEWTKPGQTPNTPGWYAYSNEYDGYVWDGPERATLFHGGAFDFSFPLHLQKVSHVFIEPENNPWPDNRFTFRVYNHDGIMLFYESPVLEAENLTEIVHELTQPLILHDQFYVAVKPVNPGGRPSSAFKSMNLGNGVSFYGSPHNWQVAGNASNQFAYATKAYIKDFENKTEELTQIPGQSFQPQNLQQQHSESYFMYFDGHDKWANAVSIYNVYKNNELIHSVNTAEYSAMNFLDENSDTTNDFDSYYVTAVYEPEGIESAPSNVTWLFHKELCDISITEFPYNEIFDNEDIPDCWTESSTGSGWQVAAQASVMDNVIDPLEGEQLLYVLQEESEDSTYNWLISPPFNIADTDNPALSFWFNANHSETTDLLSLFVMQGNGSLVKIWDASEHPEFIPENAFSWIRTVKDLEQYSSEELRIAFLVEGKGNAFAAIDHIQVMDASEHLFQLTLDIFPQHKGEVYGADYYIGGQKARVYAEPGSGFYFYYWLHNEEVVSRDQHYEFIMPGNDYELTAFFDTEAPPQSSEQGIESLSAISIFPNPNSGQFKLHFHDTLEDVLIEVVSSGGKVVHSEEHNSILANTHLDFFLDNQPNGIYYVLIHSGNSRQVVTVSITR
jgi:hypothetical protein